MTVLAAAMGFAAFAPSSVEERVPRDIFPLPVGPSSEVPASIRVSRAVRLRRRLAKACHSESACSFTTRALNVCFQGSGKLLDYQSEMSLHKSQCLHNSKNASRLPMSAAQAQVLNHVKDSVLGLGPPPHVGDLSPAGAYSELCGAAKGYDDAPKSSHPASYDPGLLSIPGKGSHPVPLATLWDHAQQFCTSDNVISSFTKCKVLPRTIAASNLIDAGVSKCYSDPLLHIPSNYGKLVRSMFDASWVHPSRSNDAIEFVEAFFVVKKNGMLRMAIDARRSNCYFAKPTHSHLCTGEALSRIEIEPGERLFLASSDLKDAFYHIELPAEWQQDAYQS